MNFVLLWDGLFLTSTHRLGQFWREVELLWELKEGEEEEEEGEEEEEEGEEEEGAEGEWLSLG